MKLSAVASITRAERLRPASTPRHGLAGAAQLDHREFPCDPAAGQRHVDDAIHRHHAIELVLDLLEHIGVPAVTMVMRDTCFGFSVSETVASDVVAAPGKQSDHPRHTPGLFSTSTESVWASFGSWRSSMK